MARRPPPPDPELAALARARLARLLGGRDLEGPRRAAGGGSARAAEPVEEPELGRSPRSRVALADLEPPRRFTRWHLGVVAVVLAVGMVWGVWSWIRARPEAVAAPAVATASVPVASSEPAGSNTPAAGSSGAEPSTSAASGLVVHVLGAVRHPGLVRLASGARVEDAIEKAGGLRADADPDELNLAQPLDDGVQVVIGTRKHPAGEVRAGGGSSGGGSSGSGSGSSPGSGPGSGSSSSGTVDLNRASADQLEALPGVGPVTAQKIVDWRQQHGRFSRAEELQEVDGIGPKTYARLAPHVRL